MCLHTIPLVDFSWWGCKWWRPDVCHHGSVRRSLQMIDFGSFCIHVGQLNRPRGEDRFCGPPWSRKHNEFQTLECTNRDLVGFRTIRRTMSVVGFCCCYSPERSLQICSVGMGSAKWTLEAHDFGSRDLHPPRRSAGVDRAVRRCKLQELRGGTFQIHAGMIRNGTSWSAGGTRWCMAPSMPRSSGPS